MRFWWSAVFLRLEQLFLGVDDSVVTPPPTAQFHDPIDGSVDWRVVWPMNLWAAQNGCFEDSNDGGLDNGVVENQFTDKTTNDATIYDLTGHVIGEQYQRIWNWLKAYTNTQ